MKKNQSSVEKAVLADLIDLIQDWVDMNWAPSYSDLQKLKERLGEE